MRSRLHRNYISLQHGELENFAIELRLNSESAFAFHLRIRYSIEGVEKTLSSDEMQIAFFGQEIRTVSPAKTSPIEA